MTAPRRWLLDLGNSRLKCAALDAHGRIGVVTAIGHDQDWQEALRRQLAPVERGDQAWLASVASAERTQQVLDLLRDAGVDTRCVHSVAHAGRLRIAYPEPARLGVDRFLAMLAASARDDGPWVIVSAGSALTVDVLARDGTHLGGLIAPMPAQMRQALAQKFSQLDVPAGTAHDLANNTADAIASGARAATLGLVERVLRQTQQRLGEQPTLLVCGGDAALLAGVEHARLVHAPSLVLDGLALRVLGGDP